MYADDSFYTLTARGQIGLVLLSLGLAVLVLWLAWRVMRGRGLVVRLGLAIGGYIAFLWLSPQVYYAYYLLLFDIPWQVVVKRPPDPGKLFNLLSFREAASLSAHGKGALGWALIAMALAGQAAGGRGSSAR